MPSQLSHQSISESIDRQRDSIAEDVVKRAYELEPELNDRYGERGRAFYLEDTHHHLDYLSQAVAVAQPLLFTEYISWAKAMLSARNVPASDLTTNLQQICSTLEELLPPDSSAIPCGYVESALQQLPQMPSEVGSFLSPRQPQSQLAQEYLDALLNGKRQDASRLILEAAQSGVSIREIYLHVFQPAQHEIGRLWQINQISVAQEHYCTAATQLIMSQLYPYLFSGERTGRSVVAACVGGDLHELGVRMVSDFFEIEGWDTFYLGANTPTPSILQAIRERHADVVAISVTITSHMRKAESLIDAIRSDEGCKDVKILVGGYPFNIAPELWRQLGADGSASNAEDAIRLAERLVPKAS